MTYHIKDLWQSGEKDGTGLLMLEKTYGLRAELMYMRLFILWNCLEREQRTHYQVHKPASQTDEARGI